MKVKPFDIFLTVFILALIFLFNFIAFDGAKNVAVVINTKSRAVELQATITSSEHYTKDDEGFETDYWEEKVSYTYNGTEYRGVLYDSSSGSSRLGKVVTVKIDPNNPDELLPDAFDFLLSAILSPVFLAGIIVALYFVLKSAAEQILEARGKVNEKASKIVAFSLMAIKLVAENILFYTNHNSAVFAIFTLIAIALIWGYTKMPTRKANKENPEPQAEAEALV